MNTRKEALNFGLISKYRSLLMGVATLFITFCHLDVAQRHQGLSETRFALLLQTLTVGVDIFLFLSGVGLYYSYTKKKPTYWRFEKRRLQRVLPLYCVIGGITYIVFDILMRRYSLGRLLSDFFFLSWPLRGSTKYWYILAISVFYLAFPLCYRCIHGGRNRLLPLLLFCTLWWFAGETLCMKVSGMTTFRQWISRFPIFLFGIYCGKLVYQKAPMNRLLPGLLIPAGFLSLVILRWYIPMPLYKYLYYPVCGLLGMSVIAVVIVLMELLERKLPRLAKLLTTILTWFGGLSLEMYLLHQSSLILFDYPAYFPYYVLCAFVLPTLTTFLIYLGRRRLHREKHT